MELTRLTQTPVTPGEERIRRHLQCETSVRLCSTLADAVQPHKRRTHRILDAPSECWRPCCRIAGTSLRQTLPSLAGVPASYSCTENAGTLIELCRSLVEHDLGTEALWASNGKQPLKFAAAATKAAMDRACGELLDRNVHLSLSIQDNLGDFLDEGLREGILLLSVDCTGCGYLTIGPALAVLDKEAVWLGAAFYHLLRLSLYRWIRVYDHTDAEMYNANLHEGAEQDGEEDQGRYEFPDVEGALPSFLRGEDNLKVEDYRALVRRHRRGPYAAWIDSLLRIAALCRTPCQAPRELFEHVWYAAILPILVMVFNQDDAIEAAFDAEAESMHEASHEPSYAAVFSPADPLSTEKALRSFKQYMAINLELFTLVEALNQHKEHSPHIRRRRFAFRKPTAPTNPTLVKQNLSLLKCVSQSAAVSPPHQRTQAALEYE